MLYETFLKRLVFKIFIVKHKTQEDEYVIRRLVSFSVIGGENASVFIPLKYKGLSDFI
jgi:hypothetical protein